MQLFQNNKSSLFKLKEIPFKLEFKITSCSQYKTNFYPREGYGTF